MGLVYKTVFAAALAASLISENKGTPDELRIQLTIEQDSIYGKAEPKKTITRFLAKVAGKDDINGTYRFVDGNLEAQLQAGGDRRLVAGTLTPAGPYTPTGRVELNFDLVRAKDSTLYEADFEHNGARITVRYNESQPDSVRPLSFMIVRPGADSARADTVTMNGSFCKAEKVTYCPYGK